MNAEILENQENIHAADPIVEADQNPIELEGIFILLKEEEVILEIKEEKAFLRVEAAVKVTKKKIKNSHIIQKVVQEVQAHLKKKKGNI